MGSESDHNDFSEEEGISENVIFVNILKKTKILFKKDCTPSAKNGKKLALEFLTTEYNLKTKGKLSTKQVLKKFNNIKSRIKETTDKNRTGNKTIILKPWGKVFFELWDGENNNPVLNRIPGAVSSGLSEVCLPEIPPESTTPRSYANLPVTSFENTTTEELERLVLIAQLEATQAQKQAAIAQERAAVAQEDLALQQKQLLESNNEGRQTAHNNDSNYTWMSL